MDRPPAPAQPPAFLPLGATVGPWRVVAWAGQGVYGAVYRAVRVGQEDSEPVALKVALLPRDPRFAREAALLARTNHPSIPRLVDAGEWQHPSGTLHPYIAMQWVDGAPLYEWVREQQPHSQQVQRLLAQLARALQALHAQGALHRDFKGDNVRVRPEERGTAQELAEALERAAPPFRPERSEERAGTGDGAVSRRRRVHAGLRWLATAAAGLVLVVGLWWSAPGHLRVEPSERLEAAGTEQPDAGTVGLGDSAATASTESDSKLPAPKVVAEEPLPEPQPGQTRPDAKGRCPGKRLVALNGGCWYEALLESKECAALGGHLFKGTCYLPWPAPKRRPTSSPADTP